MDPTADARRQTNGGMSYGFDSSDNSGSFAPGRYAQMVAQQELGIWTNRRYCVSFNHRVGPMDDWSLLAHVSKSWVLGIVV